MSRLKRAYYELWFIQQSIVLERENQRLLVQFESIARTRYVVGEVTQQDVLQAQVEVAMASGSGAPPELSQSTRGPKMPRSRRRLTSTSGPATAAKTFS